MKTRTLLTGLILALILSIIFPAAAQDGTVAMLLAVDPGALDPQGPAHPMSPILLAYIYDTLVFQDGAGQLQPYLAESWSWAEDGSAITFTLRDDVRFSNGNPVNADAVIYTFERLQTQGQRSYIYSEIANITEFEKLADYEVRFELAEPSVTLLSALSYHYAGILDPEATEAAGESFGVEPVGSGMFMIAEWVPQSRMVLTRNPHYAAQLPTDDPDVESQVEEIVVRFVRDQATMANALLAGEADIAYISSVPQLERLESDPAFDVLEDASRGILFIGFNMGGAPFDDERMRQAVAMAVRKAEIVEIAASGKAEVVHSPIPPTIFGHNPDLEADAFAYDQDAARDLIAAAGYEGESVTLLASTYPTHQTIATLLQAQLVEIGLNVELEILDYAGMRAAASAGEYDMVVTRYAWNDPDLLRLYLATEGESNRYFYSSAAFDEQVALGRRTFDLDERYAIYTEAQRIAMREVPIVPIYMSITTIVVRNTLEGVGVLHNHVLLDDVTFAD